VNCPFCGSLVADGASFCPACGRALTAPPPPPMQGPPTGYPAAPPPPPGSNAPKAAIIVVLAIVILAGIGVAAFSLIGGGDQLGACVEEWRYQSPTRKENWTRSECQAFCDGPVNDGVHLACYFDPYRIR